MRPSLRVKWIFDREPRLLPAYLNLSTAQNFKAQPVLAEQAYKEALSYVPSVETHFAIANFYMQSRRLAEAEKEYKAALAIDSMSSDASHAMAHYYMQVNQPADAEKILVQLTTRSARPLEARWFLATFIRPQANLRKAPRYFRK